MGKATQSHFGNEDVDPEARQPRVNQVFSSVAGHYDLMNDLMSAGVHRLWKQHFVAQVPHGRAFLDLAGGTGDIAFRIARRFPHADITVADINAEMLQEGKKRAIDKHIPATLHWQEANAETLPFADNRFDAVTIAFGMRNVTHIDRALSEIYRVLKHGGKFLCLEFSPKTSPLIQTAYDAYSERVIPLIGQQVTGDKEAYRYLVESIRKFPDNPAYASMLEAAGFTNVKVETLSMGIVAIHSGWRV